ncbi:TetR/AcrR family transcriptional regulator [Conexibacter woesei]|uniref:TetR/AcrR family transcriptional regulator n=1 Tax=Conexibacter woesei TaxID=191495 RepID=UPI0004154E44|nr:TetR/AcrR family transcriptional regulator C-terminal domain-containing protein [Conexibacter woesei]
MAKPNRPAFNHRKASAAPQRKPPLDRERIVAATINILDSEGPGALTFRRLAADLGAGVATLYWHVDSKEVLMDLALDHVLGEADKGFDAHPDQPWDQRLQQGMVELWELLARHPWAAHQAILSDNRGPNLLHHWDRACALLFSIGLEPDDVFYVMSTLFTYVVGVGMANALWHDYGAADQETNHAAELQAAAQLFDEIPEDEYPDFRRVLPVFTTHTQEVEFLRGLDLVLAGIRARVATVAG